MSNQAVSKKFASRGSNVGISDRIAFLDFVADSQSGELFRAGEKVRVQEKPFQILLMLLRRSGEVVTRKEICRAVWPDFIFSQANGSLNTAMRKLRTSLGEKPGQTQIIETVGSRGYRLLARPEQKALDRGNGVRLAVIPFENLGGVEHEHFAEWLTEQMIVQFAESHPEIKLAVPVSVRYRKQPGTSVCEQVRSVNPDYVLVGNVLRTQQGIRVAAKLVRVHDCAYVWWQNYSRGISDVFSVQDEITSQICSDILKVLPRPAAKEEMQGRTSPAYGKVLKGSHFAGKWDEPSFARAIEFFEQATREDPEFARAYAALARTYASMLHYGVDRPVVVQEKLREAATRALQLSPELPKALVALGCAEMFYETNWESAEKYFHHALRVNPTFGYAYQCYTRLLIATGRQEESIIAARRARDLDPFSPYSNVVLGSAFFFSRRYEEAIRPCMDCIEVEPGFAMGWAFLARSYERLGRSEDAINACRAALRCSPDSRIMLANLTHGLAIAGEHDEAYTLLNRLLTTRQSSYVPAYWIALCHLGLGEEDRAIEWLQTAVRERDGWRTLCAVDPKLDALRERVKFREMLWEIGFPGK